MIAIIQIFAAHSLSILSFVSPYIFALVNFIFGGMLCLHAPHQLLLFINKILPRDQEYTGWGASKQGVYDLKCRVLRVELITIPTFLMTSLGGWCFSKDFGLDALNRYVWRSESAVALFCLPDLVHAIFWWAFATRIGEGGGGREQVRWEEEQETDEEDEASVASESEKESVNGSEMAYSIVSTSQKVASDGEN